MAPYNREGLQAGKREPPYTVFIRLPFARGDFVDPPPVSQMTYSVRPKWLTDFR